MSAKRTPGPVRVWTVIDIVDLNGKNRKFSIQEIPEERYVDALEHLATIFFRDEPILESIDISADPVSTADMKKVWHLMLKEGISVAAFDITENQKKPILAGVNVLGFSDDLSKGLENVETKGEKTIKILDLMDSLSLRINPRKMFGVEEYITAFGLSVAPEYRRIGLAKILLETRNKIGREYNIKYTSTLFSGPISQKTAARVGFEELLVQDYDEIKDKNGEIMFPKLSGKYLKVMGKHLL